MKKIFLLTDDNISRLYPELLRSYNPDALLSLPPGESSKSIESAQKIWRFLCDNGADRHSVLICVGGGMITDLGGFAAACFKRGISHINVATTLLAAVDAAIGGKTGIDFMGLKNEIGAFKMPAQTTAYIPAFRTLPDRELLSGWAEAVKTAYIDSAEMTAEMLAADPLEIDGNDMERFVTYCRRVKTDIVSQDPTEKGLRKILNFGHTAGHAFETLMLTRDTPVPHGVAVAHGMLIALILSFELAGLDRRHVTQYVAWLREYYPPLGISCKDYDRICELTAHDKKNTGTQFANFVLLEDIGSPVFDRPVTPDQLKEALDLYGTLI